MKSKLMKPTMLALAGAVALAAAGSASAMAPPYLGCVYKGETILVPPGGGDPVTCWLNLVVKTDCDGNALEITAAGANPGDATCSQLATLGFPWTGTLPGIFPGPGSISTDDQIPFSVMNAGGTPVAGGDVSGIAGNTPQNHTCNGNVVTVPHFVTITGANNFGPLSGTFATLNTVNSLEKITCGEKL